MEKKIAMDLHLVQALQGCKKDWQLPMQQVSPLFKKVEDNTKLS